MRLVAGLVFSLGFGISGLAMAEPNEVALPISIECQDDWHKAPTVMASNLARQFDGFYMEFDVQVSSPAPYMGRVRISKSTGVAEHSLITTWQYNDTLKQNDWMGTKVYMSKPSIEGDEYIACLHIDHRYINGNKVVKGSMLNLPYPALKELTFHAQVRVEVGTTKEISFENDEVGIFITGSIH